MTITHGFDDIGLESLSCRPRLRADLVLEDLALEDLDLVRRRLPDLALPGADVKTTLLRHGDLEYDLDLV